VRSALVWTYTARLMPLPDAVLDAHAPDAGEGSEPVNELIDPHR
jgi:hypothetical protein